MTVFTVNKQARHDYHVNDTIEAGIVLHGYEVKSVRNGQVNLKGSYASIDHRNEAYIYNMHIAPYAKATSIPDYNPTRPRKLLLNKQEILKLRGTLSQKGLTVVPLSLYSKANRIKVELGLVQGKKKADKRETLKRRDIQRDLDREYKTR